MNQMKQKNGKERFSIKQYFLKENVKNVMKIYTLLIEWQSPALYIKKKSKVFMAFKLQFRTLNSYTDGVLNLYWKEIQ